MIKIKSAIVIVSLSLLAFIAYNVMTVEAAEKDDKKVCEKYNGEWKDDGSGDRQCFIDNEKDAQLYGLRPGKSLDGTGSDAEYGREDLGYDDETAAAKEDAIKSDKKEKTPVIEDWQNTVTNEEEVKEYCHGGCMKIEEDEQSYQKEKYKQLNEDISDEDIQKTIKAVEAAAKDTSEEEEAMEQEEEIAESTEAEESNDEEEEQDEGEEDESDDEQEEESDDDGEEDSSEE